MCELRPLTPALAKKAAKELNENPENRAYYLNVLRDWLQQQAHLRARTSDQFLITFLRATKFHVERAKQKLENYYIYRAMMPDIFLDRNINETKIVDIINSTCIIHLPEPIAADGPRVVMIRPKYFNMKAHTIPDVFKVGAMCTDILLYEDDNAIVAGYVLILDLSNLSKDVLFSFDPNFAQKLTILANKISPTRMRGFHILNVSPIIERLFNMVKSVINVKLRERFHAHGSKFESLYEYVPRHILPQEYGGNCDIESLKIDWWKKLRAHEHFIREEETYGLKEDYRKLRCTKVTDINNDSLFGIQGNFRKLNFD